MNDGRRRVVIENLSPQVEGGRFPAKRAVGEVLTVTADIFVDGHDALQAVVRYRLQGEESCRETPMTPLPNDTWRAAIPVVAQRDIHYTVEAWVDHFGTWRQRLEKKFAAGQPLAVELLDGAALLRTAARRAAAAGAPEEGELLERFAARLTAEEPGAAVALAAESELRQLMDRHVDRTLASRFAQEFYVHVEPALAAASAWYELFPRSAGAPGRHGRFADIARQLPRIAAMGFDILYLPPIHPIGESFRKGPNNTPQAAPGDLGSPWAIGAATGGHDAVHPELGTLEEFRQLVAASAEAGLAVALDIAFQCSPDHPWVREHPGWFRTRADGSIQYAENPPKRYQDVYPFDFECEDWQALWAALRDVFLFWAGQGVSIFRVDNPHTKPIGFWYWCLAEVRRACPEAIFLSEAFTRPKVMYRLAKAGFSQSYTYFTWRNSKAELTRYLTELVHEAPRDFFRPNFWPNTPDILPEYLQYGGRPAFVIRLVLAATLSSNYGIYGPAFELCAADALPGSEEYQDSEKYQLRDWDLQDPGSLEPFIARVNAVRRAHPALRQMWNLRFLETDNDCVLCFAKHDDAGGDLVVVAVNLDPHHTQGAWLTLPLEEFDLAGERSYMVHDLLGDDKFIWQGARNFMEFDPRVLPARIFHVKRRLQRETDFDYFM